jgi:2-iminobutanoate/2-iminopropanoate deaminase
MSRRAVVVGAAPLARYAPAIDADGVVFVSGQVPTDPAGSVVGTDIRSQTRQVFANLAEVLRHAGLGLDDVCHVHTSLVHRDDSDGFDDVVGETFTQRYPARITVRGDLLLDDARLESTAIAVRPRS